MKLTLLDKAFGMDQAALDSATLHDSNFPKAERARRRALNRRAGAARKRNR